MDERMVRIREWEVRKLEGSFPTPSTKPNPATSKGLEITGLIDLDPEAKRRWFADPTMREILLDEFREQVDLAPDGPSYPHLYLDVSRPSKDEAQAVFHSGEQAASLAGSGASEEWERREEAGSYSWVSVEQTNDSCWIS